MDINEVLHIYLQSMVNWSDRQRSLDSLLNTLEHISNKEKKQDVENFKKRDRSKNFETNRGRSGIIGRILQPKGYSYCHTIYHTDTVTESSSERLTPHLPRHCRPRATEYITVRLLYIYHHILSTDNKEILLPPTVSIIPGLALQASSMMQGTSSAGEDIGYSTV